MSKNVERILKFLEKIILIFEIGFIKEAEIWYFL